MSPLQRVAWLVARAGGGEGAPPSRLLNKLLQVIKWQRTVAKEASDVARAAELAAEEQQLRHAVDEASQRAEEGRDILREARAGTQERPIVPLMVSCRDRVRAELLSMRAAAADDAPTRERHLRTILSLADELARLAKAEAETEAAEVAEVVAPAANTIEARSAQRGDSAKRRMTGVMTGVWRYECRCGDEFVLREAQLAAGIDVLQCKSCSYSLRPLYCRVDDG